MESGPPQVVMNPYEWLPSYGESRVWFGSQGMDWVIEIEYEGPSGKDLLIQDLRFHNAYSFHEASFPGPSLLDIKSRSGANLGALLEYPESEAALAWNRYLVRRTPVKHYSIVFLSANIGVHVFAESWELSSPRRALTRLE